MPSPSVPSSAPLERRSTLSATQGPLPAVPSLPGSVKLPPSPSAAEANAAVRAFASGRTIWTPTALEELDRLRSAWQRAVRREVVKAA